MRTTLLIALLLSGSSLISQIDEVKHEVDKIIRYDTELDFDDVPGFVVSIIDSDSIFYLGFGDLEHHPSPQEPIFEVGSISKVFTSALVSLMQSESLIDKHGTYNSYLDLNDQNPRMEKLTIEELITHRSCLPRRPGFFGKYDDGTHSPYAHYQVDDLKKFYREYVPNASCDFIYSHANYALLTHLISSLENTSYESSLQKRILKHLGMNNTFVTFAEKNIGKLTVGYDKKGEVVAPWNFSTFEGSEGIKTNLRDLSVLITAHLGISGHHLDDVLNYENIRPVNTNLNESIENVAGWFTMEDVGRYRIYSHSGRTSGHSAFVAFIRETKTGVVILANSSIGTQDLGLLVLRMINRNWKRKA